VALGHSALAVGGAAPHADGGDGVVGDFAGAGAGGNMARRARVTTVLLLARRWCWRCCWRCGRAARPQSRGLETLGNLTYSSYLLHFPLQIGIATACGLMGVTVPW
jgi:peptidoglycan/LPS O-acetylase OafA/YrhL